MDVSIARSEEAMVKIDKCNSSLQYRLPERLRMHPAQAITLQASANIQGTRCELLP